MLGGDEFGIAQATDAIAWLEYHCCSDDGAEQATTADLIHSGDQLRTCQPRALLELLRALQALEQAHLCSRGGELLGAVRKERCAGNQRRSVRRVLLDFGRQNRCAKYSARVASLNEIGI